MGERLGTNGRGEMVPEQGRIQVVSRGEAEAILRGQVFGSQERAWREEQPELEGPDAVDFQRVATRQGIAEKVVQILNDPNWRVNRGGEALAKRWGTVDIAEIQARLADFLISGGYYDPLLGNSLISLELGPGGAALIDYLTHALRQRPYQSFIRGRQPVPPEIQQMFLGQMWQHYGVGDRLYVAMEEILAGSLKDEELLEDETFAEVLQAIARDLALHCQLVEGGGNLSIEELVELLKHPDKFLNMLDIHKGRQIHSDRVTAEDYVSVSVEAQAELKRYYGDPEGFLREHFTAEFRAGEVDRRSFLRPSAARVWLKRFEDLQRGDLPAESIDMLIDSRALSHLGGVAFREMMGNVIAWMNWGGSYWGDGVFDQSYAWGNNRVWELYALLQGFPEVARWGIKERWPRELGKKGGRLTAVMLQRMPCVPQDMLSQFLANRKTHSMVDLNDLMKDFSVILAQVANQAYGQYYPLRKDDRFWRRDEEAFDRGVQEVYRRMLAETDTHHLLESLGGADLEALQSLMQDRGGQSIQTFQQIPGLTAYPSGAPEWDFLRQQAPNHVILQVIAQAWQMADSLIRESSGWMPAPKSDLSGQYRANVIQNLVV